VSIRNHAYESDERELLSGYELLCALAEWQREAEVNGSLGWDSQDPSQSVLETISEGIERLSEEEAPAESDLDDRMSWLRGVELLELARRACLALGPDVAWASGLVGVLQDALDTRERAVAQSAGWWRLGRVAEDAIFGGDPRPPWSWIGSGVEVGEVHRELDEDAREVVVECWVRGDLAEADHRGVLALVVGHEVWRRCYREVLGRWLRLIRVVAVPPALGPAILRSFPLPHLGRGARGEVRLAGDGLALSWPRGGADAPLSLVWEGDSIEYVIRDEVAGEVTLRFERVAPDLGATTAAALSALVKVQRDPDWPRESAHAAARAAMALLSDDEAWRGSLSRSAEDFREGRLVEEEDVLLVERALEVRAALDTVLFRYLDPDFGKALKVLDERLADVADAVLAVPGERYYELLELAEPEAGSWWAAWQDLDDAVPEEAIAEALSGDVAEPKSDRWDPVVQLFAPQERYLAAAATRAKIPSPVQLLSQDGEWSVIVGVTKNPRVKQLLINRRSAEIPPGTEVRLLGVVKQVVATGTNNASVEIADDEVWPVKDTIEYAILLPDGQVVPMHVEE
jgi:hypothetical protein